MSTRSERVSWLSRRVQQLKKEVAEYCSSPEAGNQPLTQEQINKLMERTPLEIADARRREVGDSWPGDG